MFNPPVCNNAIRDVFSVWEAIRTLLALGALPEAIKADVWAELQPQDFGGENLLLGLSLFVLSAL